ncbi:uncharacterized protein LOC129870833 [Solanum dulcamara]|uniref:uncharacterized protein LOC129870833 n=1 Tax=Solanum dulcamara TaxID=45834 RepID=UPI002484E1BA|nr:uncharacterized protein LOC129870833 [Solanum dulcamara]
MAAEEVLLLKLFDTYWFEQGILFTNTHKFSYDIQDKKAFQENPHEIQGSSKFFGRSQSDYLCGSDSLKILPDACETLQKQHSFGGSDTSFSQLGNSPTSVIITHNRVAVKAKKGVKGIIRIRRSSSELELEELKGFMDLGFEFSEEDKNSSLVTIVPGLQKWGNRAVVDEKRDNIVHKRPYLSESWEILEKRKMSRKLLKWRFPSMNDDMNMKDNLRFWAQTVASTFR